MRQARPEYKSKPAEPVPDSTEPPVPVFNDPDTEPSNDSIPFDDVVSDAQSYRIILYGRWLLQFFEFVELSLN